MEQRKDQFMIHRALYGSLERFFGILIEHYAGAFPTWLAPVQVVVLPVSEKYVDYAKELSEKFDKYGIRVELDDRNETLGYRIRENQIRKVPYMIIVGEKRKNLEKSRLEHVKEETSMMWKLKNS